MKRSLMLGLISGLLTITLLTASCYFYPEKKQLTVSMLDIGQGDSFFIRTPSDRLVMIDAGANARVLPELGKELGFFERHIDLIVLTHPDLDHIGGFSDVLRRYDVGAALITGVLHDSSAYADILKTLAEKRIPVSIATAAHDVDVGDGTKLDVLYPLDSQLTREPTNSNQTSIVARLTYGETSALFTGDADETVEKELLKTGASLKSDILKLGHHGAKTSSSQAFVDAVSPTIALISAGKDNSYSHPHAETLARLPKNIIIYDTRTSSTTTLTSDGVTWQTSE